MLLTVTNRPVAVCADMKGLKMKIEPAIDNQQ
jgi:hypothetical protein